MRNGRISFAKHKPRRINITLYGADDQAYGKLCHYPAGFQKTVNAIRMLRDREIDVKINGSITSKNEEDIKKIFRYCKTIRCSSKPGYIHVSRQAGKEISRLMNKAV